MKYNNVVTTAVLACALTIMGMVYNHGEKIASITARLDATEANVTEYKSEIAEIKSRINDMSQKVTEQGVKLEALLPDKKQFKIKDK